VTSSRPYLIRALWEWANDNGMTPHVLVNATLPKVDVPREFVQDGRITLNLSPSAVQGLVMGNEEFRFAARFAGRSRLISFPTTAVLALYCRENGEGMLFGNEPGQASASEAAMAPAASNRPPSGVSQQDAAFAAGTGLAAPPDGTSESGAGTAEPVPDPPPKPRGRPALKLIK
jgi:stringent starvation protein B